MPVLQHDCFICTTQVLSEFVKVDLAMERTVSSSGTAAVVDGATLQLTPLQRALVPPPMCAVAAVLPHPVQCLAFGNHQGHEVKPFLLACRLLHVCCPFTAAYHGHTSLMLFAVFAAVMQLDALCPICCGWYTMSHMSGNYLPSLMRGSVEHMRLWLCVTCDLVSL
jgi:hypothetical protein